MNGKYNHGIVKISCNLRMYKKSSFTIARSWGEMRQNSGDNFYLEPEVDVIFVDGENGKLLLCFFYIITHIAQYAYKNLYLNLLFGHNFFPILFKVDGAGGDVKSSRSEN